MKEFDVFTIKSIYRDDFRVRGYQFGEGEKTLCIVGAMRGNEQQQLYISSRIVKRLSELESRGMLDPAKEVLVIPCCNPYSVNISKRFWTIDNTDINRMFPGYNEGETTQRIAAGIFSSAQQYSCGIQFASFYLKGTFAPHVRMMETGFEDVGMAMKFGFPYVVIRKPRPFDTTTLNYNWQIWNTSAFSLYTTTTESIDPVSASRAVEAIIRFLGVIGVVRGGSAKTSVQEDQGAGPLVVHDENLLNLRADCAGFFETYVKAGDPVRKGQLLAILTDPYEGTEKSRITAPEDGAVLFMHLPGLAYADTSLLRLIVR